MWATRKHPHPAAAGPSQRKRQAVPLSLWVGNVRVRAFLDASADG
jgi:hypothetical protein